MLYVLYGWMTSQNSKSIKYVTTTNSYSYIHKCVYTSDKVPILNVGVFLWYTYAYELKPWLCMYTYSQGFSVICCYTG